VSPLSKPSEEKLTEVSVYSDECLRANFDYPSQLTFTLRPVPNSKTLYTAEFHLSTFAKDDQRCLGVPVSRAYYISDYISVNPEQRQVKAFAWERYTEYRPLTLREAEILNKYQVCQHVWQRGEVVNMSLCRDRQRFPLGMGQSAEEVIVLSTFRLHAFPRSSMELTGSIPEGAPVVEVTLNGTRKKLSKNWNL
jgi:hypothetical protein